ncbi:MAG: gdh [Actinomycetia bacterium]|nr:gdh [Actinomycetes bacterium]
MPPEGPAAAIVEEVARRATALVPAADATAVAAFARRYYENVALADLHERSIDFLAEAAASHWQFGAQRPPHTPLVRVFTPTRERDGWDSTHTIIEIVNDDMPFVVDSVMMELDRRALGIHLIVHPILPVVRDADGTALGLAADDSRDGTAQPDGNLVAVESFVHAEVDRETDAATLEETRKCLLAVLRDLRAATTDWAAMLGVLRHVLDDLSTTPPPVDADELAEGRAFLDWMADQHFTFVGYRRYELVTDATGDALRPIPGSGLGVLRNARDDRSTSFAELPPEVRRRARDKELLVLTKANSRSTIHRPAYLDYVGVKTFDANGDVNGEHRFLGLWTSSAYNASPIDVPVVRRKITAVMERAGFAPQSHDQKDLVNILETYPRDDLFQIETNTFFDIVMGILQLQERRRVRLFVHRERYGRFVSCLVFVPRDRYTTALRLRVAQLLLDAYNGSTYEWNTRLSESVLARLHFVLRTDPTRAPDVDVAALESQIAAATRLWVDDLRETLVSNHGEETGLAQFRTYATAFPLAYQEDFDPSEALADIAQLERLDDRTTLTVRLANATKASLDFKLYGTGAQLSLSDVLPRLRNMGVVVDDEHPYVITPVDTPPRWIKHFRLRYMPASELDVGAVQRTFEDAFLAVTRGDAEDDGFNRLVLAAGLAWREVAVLRAYAKYLRQAGTLFSQDYIASTLTAHPGIARMLMELFVARFDPWEIGQGGDAAERLWDDIVASLDAVKSLDEDRILRNLASLVRATLRTNWFQSDDQNTPRRELAFKLDPSLVPDLPLPRPTFEIFVYSPRVEGVHLRAGKVARGGIRWSDRREDFRTEVLDLMKAQRVKNAVIVPSGAKGGFVVKQPPALADRDALQAEVVECYRSFIGAMLDVTDNLVDGTVVPPAQVVRYDDDDPYLVVAADKGTATFSDIANEIALSRGFWLGDAFASGGSAGYDHKKMGITARGAWESVKHHFREIAIDPTVDDFTVVGIGDMSGDVFGNAMLLSEHIRLVAAFDHRHVFLDPHPVAETSFAERKRLFALSRSSWDDYDRSLLSPGGGIYARTLKSIPVSPEVAEALGIDTTTTSLTPMQLIRTVLRAPVDLLFNGGIGTYVKAHDETHTDVGDKANDVVRVDGSELQVKVVAEGGNLGLTQRGRIEYALHGGLINTDAIDNSAGVDTSDHEVNIKILLDGIVRTRSCTLDDRNALLVQMTDEVAALVLRDNYRQNRALANARAQSIPMVDVHLRFIHELEQSGLLNRVVEQLPDDETLEERHATGVGLTAPELAVLLAYAKIEIEEDLLESTVPDDPDFVSTLERYFPGPLQERYPEAIQGHALRREIVATALVNAMVNRAGSTFAFRMAQETGATSPDIVRAHEAAWRVFDQERLWRAIESLDARVPGETQTEMYLESRKLVERASRWFLRNRRRPLPVSSTVVFFSERVARLAERLPDLLLGSEHDWVENETTLLASRGVPVDIARWVATLESLYTALDITDLAEQSKLDVEHVAAMYATVGDHLRLDWLRDRIVELPRDDRWQALSRLALREDAYGEHRAVTAAVLAGTDPGFDAETAYKVWAAGNRPRVERVLSILDDIRAHGIYDLSTLSVALRELRGLEPEGRR